MNKLTKQQKYSLALLSLGTFLEYFDLMLYVHMAALLNELFFPKTDAFATFIISAFTFCITFVFRPIGAAIFGYIGDYIGRKFVIVLTSIIMALTCLTMSFLPTYAQIGVTATWIMLLCRIVQSMSSMNELLGSEIYILEIIPDKPMQFSAVSTIPIFSSLGGLVALWFSSLLFVFGISWRWAFGVGAIIALFSILSRRKLKESANEVDFQKFFKNTILNRDNKKEIIENKYINPKINWKTIFNYGVMEIPYVIIFYFCFIYCSGILKNTFGYTPEQIIQHNSVVVLFSTLNYFLISYLSYKIYPLILAKIRLIIVTSFVLFLPFFLDNLTTTLEVMLIQIFLEFFIPTTSAGASIIFSYFPVAKRFRSIALTFSIGRAFVYVITSFGIIYLIDYYGNYGILIVALPFLFLNYIGLNYFIKLEKKSGNFKSFYN